MYKATVIYGNKTKEYIESTGNHFKTRYNTHINSFTNRNKTNATELSKFIWTLKDEYRKFDIKWSIIHHMKSLRASEGCSLCNLERIELAKADKRKTLNRRNELQAKCPYRKGRYFPPLRK